jgi:hypothetical protein
MFYDTRGSQSLSQAASGNGIFSQRESNNITGLGPHAALELARRLGSSGWGLYGKIDFADSFTWTNQGFTAQSTSLGGSLPYRTFGHQDIPMINTQVGVTWKSSVENRARLFLGYQYEHWWSLEKINNNNTLGSLGQLSVQGIVLQGTFNY